MEEEIIAILKESIYLKNAIINSMLPEITMAIEKINTTIKDGGKIILFGNGGSAADAQHLAAELIGRFQLHRRAIPALALTTNTSILTSISNDYHFQEIFIKQLEGLLREEDLVIAISTSGNSLNVLKAVEYSKETGAFTIGMTGMNGGKLKTLVDLCLSVPSNNTARIQEAHITIGHIICQMVEKNFVCRDKISLKVPLL